MDEPDCKHFQSFCDDGHQLNNQDKSGTRQGTYCVTPSGILLGSINSRDPRRIAQLLESSYAKWKELSREERLLAFDPAIVGESINRVEKRYPQDGLVLRVVSRDLARVDDKRDSNDWRTHAWNFDHAWFLLAEVRRLVPAEFEVGAEHAWPHDLAHRLARLHLVDNVRGQTQGFERSAVREARLTAHVLKIEKQVVHLRLEGRVDQADHRHDQRGPPPDPAGEPVRGLEVVLLGTASFDTEAARFVAFDLVAVGTRFGGTQFNQRHDDLAAAPIGFHLTLASDHPTSRIAPADFWSYGWR